MDIKVQGINEAIIRDGLKQALAGRLEDPRQDDRGHAQARRERRLAPRITTIKINPRKIREIIGGKASMIRKIQEETSTEINVEDDGTCRHRSRVRRERPQGIDCINSLTREVEVGSLYMGKVTGSWARRLRRILPGKEGLVHRRAGRLPRPDRRGRRVRRRRDHGGRPRGRPPGPASTRARRPCSATSRRRPSSPGRPTRTATSRRVEPAARSIPAARPSRSVHATCSSWGHRVVSHVRGSLWVDLFGPSALGPCASASPAGPGRHRRGSSSAPATSEPPGMNMGRASREGRFAPPPD